MADHRYCFPIPEGFSDLQAAPLLCAGLIGYRSLRLAGDAERLGLYGFGASAHIVAQVAKFQGRKVFAFTKPGDEEGQAFARELGADWAGGSDERPPEQLDAAEARLDGAPPSPQASRRWRRRCPFASRCRSTRSSEPTRRSTTSVAGDSWARPFCASAESGSGASPYRV